MELERDLRENLCRLARFGANISDAHSCFIFLPVALFSPSLAASGPTLLELAGSHSLSQDVLPGCRVPIDGGLVGWVAKHRRSIHVSPFEHDSRTLGMYRVDQELKSFIGIPMVLDPQKADDGAIGVIACDSRKSFAFSKIQGKLLEDLAVEAANTVKLICRPGTPAAAHSDWDLFLHKCGELAASMGLTSVEVLRVKQRNYEDVELAIGTEAAAALVEQLYRLIQQALPPHLPMLRLPNGDLILFLDNMMTAFYESRVGALAEHLCAKYQGTPPLRLEFAFMRRSFRKKEYRSFSLERLIADSCRDGEPGKPVPISLEYEYRRA